MSEAIRARMAAPGPKRILSLDGGGVRGLVELGVLAEVEETLAARSRNPETFRLSDYFDLIGGASTGAIIATLLALGWKVDDIRTMYLGLCPRVFSRRTLLGRIGLASKFDTSAFASALDDAFSGVAKDLGVRPTSLTLGSDALKTGLAIVAKRIDTGSVWVQTNVPTRRFWSSANRDWWPEGGDFDDNQNYPLRMLVQASASAPYFLDPVSLQISDRESGVFIDGGASPHNNPSKELFMTACLRRLDGGPSPHGLGWATGADKLMMLSIGAGSFRRDISGRDYTRDIAAKSAVYALQTIIEDCANDSVAWLQALSRPSKPWLINANIEDMRGLSVVDEPLLTFQRVNALLEHDWLSRELGMSLTRRELERTREFDWAGRRNLEVLDEIGVKTGERSIAAADFPPAFDV